jgi:hypothetical protein
MWRLTHLSASETLLGPKPHPDIIDLAGFNFGNSDFSADTNVTLLPSVSNLQTDSCKIERFRNYHFKPHNLRQATVIR